ncbi:MAG: hypothetical protein OXF27_17240 [Acidobacteria bacterium]|nr:hypothetical protein [Acidobacteriota bacterium]
MRIPILMLTGALGLAVAGCGAPEPAPAVPAPAEETAAADDCAPVGEIRFICNLISPEDLAVLPGEEWVIASGNQEGGMLHLVNVGDKTSSVLYPTAAPRERLDAAAYPTCPGPMDPTEGAAFRAHGLYLKPGDGGVHTVYLVHHGNRESVEVFEIDGNANPPELTWIGCAVAPEGLNLNAVVALPDGGFAATSFRTAGLADTLEAVMTGAISGSVWEWHADGGWTEVPGTETGGPNGLEISADGQWFHIGGWGEQRFIRVSRGRDPVERDAVDLHFRPDNVRRQADGSVFAAGADHFNTPEETFHVARIDPQAMTFERVIDRPVIERFAACTAAVQIGDEIWMGTNRGEKIGYFPAP